MNTVFANLAWCASNVPGWLRFRIALQSPRVAQLELLQKYVRENAVTAYGRTLGLDRIRSYAEFQRRVPFVTYDELEPWIARIRRGEANVLTRERVTHLIPTSGSTAARKLIPFTAGLQREFNRAIAPWIGELYRAHPSLVRGTAYWSITPVGAPCSEESLVPIGFEDDASYLGAARRKLVSVVMAVPSAVSRIADIETFRYVTLLCLLRRRDLSLISVWHPSFLTLLLDALPQSWERLLADIEAGGCSVPLQQAVTRELNLHPTPNRAAELNGFVPAGSSPYQTLMHMHQSLVRALWPALRVISCWADGASDLAAEEVKGRFPEILVQPKGLLATEAFVTVPFAGAWPLAVRSHFFEFLDEHGRALLADELQPGQEYEVVVTTVGGLWRYRLGDRVRVMGFAGRTPSLKFIGRAGNVSDRFGEKLSEGFVTEVIREMSSDSGPKPVFAMLAPDKNEHGPLYTLYVEALTSLDSAERLDALLRRNPHYDYCRRLGQLQAARVFRVRGRGYETYVAYETKLERRLGDIKPCALSRFTGWSQRFDGHYVHGVTDARARDVSCRELRPY